MCIRDSIKTLVLSSLELGNSILDLSNIPTLNSLTIEAGFSIESINVAPTNVLQNLHVSNMDISGLPLNQLNSLKELQLSSILGISEILDLGANLDLEQLEINSTPFIFIDLSNNTKISTVELNSNLNLRAIDVKNGTNENIIWFILNNNHPAMECIQVDSVNFVLDNPNWSVPNEELYNEICSQEDDSTATNANIKIYPNPVKESFYIESSGPENVKYVNIIDIYGRKIRAYQLKAYDEVNEIDVRTIGSGLYFIQTISNKATVSTTRLIIQ